MRIGIVNDELLAVEALRRVVTANGDHSVAWIARNGREAVEMCATDTPDVVLMDLIMLVMDGVEATRRIMAASPCAVLIVTGDVLRNTTKVFAAMGAGALDVVATPTLAGDAAASAAALLAKVRMVGKLGVIREPADVVPRPRNNDRDAGALLVIGASAGGPPAVAHVLRDLPESFSAAVLIVQHVAVEFVESMADWLDSQTSLSVTLARPGIRPQRGSVYLAPGPGHLVLRRDQSLGFDDDPHGTIYSPSADVLFESVAQHWHGQVVGVILTGMGKDGAVGLKALRDIGARTIAQNRESSAVFGMPRAAAEAGAATDIVPLSRIGTMVTGLLNRITPRFPFQHNRKMTAPDDDPTLAFSGDSAMVLLVDDQPIIGEAVRRMLLQERGIAFHFCSNPSDAVDAANTISPTVILQDLVMPGVDGLELLRRFRANRQTAETPIVVLSSKEDANVKREAFTAGASDYLVKLPDQIELVARMRYHSMACINQRRRNEIAAALRESQRALAERVIELQAALEEIEQLQRAKTDFYSMVTHDLRNPAGIVRSAAKLLLDGADGDLTPRQQRLVQITANGSDKMLRLITDYLDYAKIDAGYLRLDLYEVDLCLVLARAMEAAQPLAELKGQSLTGEDPNCAVVIRADGGKLEQVLENLLSNAIKYTADGGTITASLRTEGDRVVFRVRDSGVGIDPTELSHLFTKYHRLPGEATRAVSGTGLGLLIAKEIVEGHGGSIHAESTGVPGEGTTFVVEIPNHTE